MKVTLEHQERFLVARFPQPQRTLSWAILGGGFGVHAAVISHFVTRAELGEDVDPRELLVERFQARGYLGAVGLLTARWLSPYADVARDVGSVRARAIVTAGLGNALRAGDPTHQERASPEASAAPRPARVGTINVVCALSTRLSDEGLLEALALATEARTAALLALGHPSVMSGLPASGTGTDCIVVACPFEGEAERYAGKHTAIGAALGRAVHDATHDAVTRWLAEQEPLPPTGSRPQRPI